MSRAEVLSQLRQQQFCVTPASGGSEALHLLDSNDCFDLVVTDFSLDDMSAYTLLGELRQRYGEDTLSVIALAGVDDRQHAARFLQRGGTEFIQKPFLVDEFNSRMFPGCQHPETYSGAAWHRCTRLSHRHLQQALLFPVRAAAGRAVFAPRRTTSIAILDIDHFKRLNDTYGHEVGDLVLKAVCASACAGLSERSHLLARLGGEEFGVLFNGLDVAAASEFCEMLRLDLAQAKVVADDEELSVTVSIGLATIEGLGNLRELSERCRPVSLYGEIRRAKPDRVGTDPAQIHGVVQA